MLKAVIRKRAEHEQRSPEGYLQFARNATSFRSDAPNALLPSKAGYKQPVELDIASDAVAHSPLLRWSYEME
jgi:hypothetical protein